MAGQSGRTRILEYLLITLALPVMVWIELNEASRDISLALTGGKYEGYGRINRRRGDGDDEPDPDWLRPPDYSHDNFRRAVSRAQRRQYIEKRADAAGRPQWVLTKAGQARAIKTFPLLKLANRPWQGWWLVVTFDIPEIARKIRDSIRRQLTAIGFVQWQKSVYISPHDIADDLAQVIRNNHLEDKVIPMISKRILAGNDWEFARRIFHIDEIEKRYRHVTELLVNPPKSKYPREFLRRQFSRYTQVLHDDPLLPVGLAPKSGYGREAALAALHSFAKDINASIPIR
jgi:DNA-binding transcriptional regulator PaaX